MSLLNVTATAEFAQVSALLAQFPDVFRKQLLAELKTYQPKLLELMRAGVPSRSGPRPAFFRGSSRRPAGGLKSLLTAEVDEDELRLSAGLLTAQARADGFYGFILDAGRGLLRSRSRPGTRRLPTSQQKVRNGRLKQFSRRYDRKISRIAPERYDIAFGRVRESARADGGTMLSAVYERAIDELGWSKR